MVGGSGERIASISKRARVWQPTACDALQREQLRVAGPHVCWFCDLQLGYSRNVTAQRCSGLASAAANHLVCQGDPPPKPCRRDLQRWVLFGEISGSLQLAPRGLSDCNALLLAACGR